MNIRLSLESGKQLSLEPAIKAYLAWLEDVKKKRKTIPGMYYMEPSEAGKLALLFFGRTEFDVPYASAGRFNGCVEEALWSWEDWTDWEKAENDSEAYESNMKLIYKVKELLSLASRLYELS
jgi:hypothetical protein